jgi:hypothetical protein
MKWQKPVSNETGQLHQEVAPFGGFFGKLADPLIIRMCSRDIKGNLETLRDVLESDK